jgi:polar amino acid transport system substrate-binding protein
LEDVVVRKCFRAAIVAAFSTMALTAPLCASAQDEKPANPYAGRTELLPEGKSLFNQYCSHCHGPNAVQGERPRDLRRLKIRYKDNAIAVFYKTINEGRMDKGMPPWKGIISDDVMWRIFTYLDSVQTQP